MIQVEICLFGAYIYHYYHCHIFHRRCHYIRRRIRPSISNCSHHRHHCQHHLQYNYRRPFLPSP